MFGKSYRIGEEKTFKVNKEQLSTQGADNEARPAGRPGKNREGEETGCLCQALALCQAVLGAATLTLLATLLAASWSPDLLGYCGNCSKAAIKRHGGLSPRTILPFQGFQDQARAVPSGWYELGDMLTHALLLLQLPARRNKLLVNGQGAQTPIFQDFLHWPKFFPHIQSSGFRFRAQMEWNNK